MDNQCSLCDRVCVQDGPNARVHEQGSDYMAVGRNIKECAERFREKLIELNQELCDEFE